jgi:hypothetical protein
MNAANAAATVQSVKTFLSRQPCQGILLSLPGEWDAWFGLDVMWTGSAFVHGPMESTWACWRTLPDCLWRCTLRKQAITPQLRNSVRLLLEIRDETMGIWEALHGVIQQHERWSVARRTWIRAAVLAGVK